MSSGENPFTEALRSEALGELLKDEAKQGLAKQLTENLKKLSEMFVKLSDAEKMQFAKEFKGQFVNQLKNLNEMARQHKVVQENGEAQKNIPEFGAADAFQEQVDSFLVIGFGMLIVLFVVFFGYKLYLSLTEKERKREEKLKAKQSKKKK
uniref:Protein with signal anchor n=1 Tax=Culex tarsalis TaxID=7177 RepID=A0A1Q3FYI4_CULTA